MKHLISSYNKIIKNEKDFKKSKFDSKNIKWDGTLEKAFEKKQLGQFKEEQIRRTSLRPFVDSYVYFSKQFKVSFIEFVLIVS